MNKFPKFLTLLGVTVLFIFLLSACGDETATDPEGTSDQGEAAEKEATAPNDSEEPTDYPNRPINIVIPWGTGGGSDQMMRMWTEAIKDMGIDVDFKLSNMPGANGVEGLNFVMSQPMDGYTLYQLNPPNYIVDNIEGNHDYGIDDMTPIFGIGGSKDMFYISGEDDRFDDWSDLEEYARENPGELQIGVAGLSGFTIASAQGFLDEIDLDMELVPYGDPSERFAALMGGQVDLLFQRIADVKDFVESGEFKPLIVFSEERMEQYPDIPTTVESGAPNATMVMTRGLAIPSEAPDEAAEFIIDVFDQAKEHELIQEYQEKQLNDALYIGEEFGEFIENQAKALGDK